MPCPLHIFTDIYLLKLSAISCNIYIFNYRCKELLSVFLCTALSKACLNAINSKFVIFGDFRDFTASESSNGKRRQKLG